MDSTDLQVHIKDWYFVIVNGRRHGFLKSSRGLRQGDPISPFLFIISTELLSKMMNNLYDKQGYNGFYMKSIGPRINHLSFAGDTILFCNDSKKPLEMMLKTLKLYEEVSRQLLNKEKSCFQRPINQRCHY